MADPSPAPGANNGNFSSKRMVGVVIKNLLTRIKNILKKKKNQSRSAALCLGLRDNPPLFCFCSLKNIKKALAGADCSRSSGQGWSPAEGLLLPPPALPGTSMPGDKMPPGPGAPQLLGRFLLSPLCCPRAVSTEVTLGKGTGTCPLRAKPGTSRKPQEMPTRAHGPLLCPQKVLRRSSSGLQRCGSGHCVELAASTRPAQPNPTGLGALAPARDAPWPRSLPGGRTPSKPRRRAGCP